jgi:hypothetical protein
MAAVIMHADRRRIAWVPGLFMPFSLGMADQAWPLDVAKVDV